MSDKVIGAQEVVRRIKRVRAAALGVVADAQIQKLLLARVRGRFVAGVSPDGTPWPGLMASTVARKGRNGSNNPKAPLRDTDRLFDSIAVIQGTNAGLLSGNTGYGFRIGVTDSKASRYGRLHNYGLGGQEQRQFLGLGAADVASVRTFINRRMKSIAQV